jgi:CheY-specific phosphatase CheX
MKQRLESLEADILQVVQSVWSSTLGLPVERCAIPESAEGTREPVAVRIALLGSAPASLSLVCCADMAEAAARALFGLDSEDLDERDLTDAVSELVNIIAGNLRELVSPGSQLGLPETVMPVAAPAPAGGDSERGPAVLFLVSAGLSFSLSINPLERGQAA